MVALFIGLPLTGFIYPESSATSALGSFNILMVIGIPLLTLIMLIMRLFLRSNFRPKWQFGLWAFWLINVICIAIIGVSTAKDFSHKSDANIGSTMYNLEPDTLFIEMENSPFEDTWFRIGDELIFSDDQLVSSNIHLYFRKSDSNKLEIEQKNYARGSSMSESQELAEMIEYNYQLDGNTLKLPSYFVVKNGEKWRTQNVRIYIKIPEGKYVIRNRDVRRSTQSIDYDDSYKFPYYGYNDIWQMGPNGMVAPEYISEYKKEFPFDKFSKIRVEGKIKLHLKQGKNYHIEMLRGADYYDEIQVNQADDRLNISTKADPNEVIMLSITLPNLEEVWAINSDDIEIRDFEQENLHIVNEGESQIKVFGDIENMDIHLTGDNSLDIRGEGNTLTAVLSDDAKLDAEHFTVQNANIELASESWAKVSATDTLWQKVIDSELISRRNPVVIDNN